MANQPAATAAEQSETYAIGVVSQMTGLSVHTIRAWEKRYGVVEPNRTGTQRRAYSREHVEKLRLLRALVEAGDTISSVAHLPVAQLEQRLEGLNGAVSGLAPVPAGWSGTGTPRVGVAGSSFLSLFETQAALLSGMELSQAWDSLESALGGEPPADALDVLVVEVDALFPGRMGRIRDLAVRSRAGRVIVVYAFAPQHVVTQLNRIPRFTALRGPVNAEEIRLAAGRWCEAPVPIVPATAVAARRADGPGAPARLFTARQLARVGRMAPENRCECTQHLAHLIGSLTAFETYTAECENLAGADQGGAGVHALVHRATAQARHRMELALQQVLQAHACPEPPF